MNSPDYRQQEEIEEQRQTILLEVLHHVSHGTSTKGHALLLAAELGLLTQYLQENDSAQYHRND